MNSANWNNKREGETTRRDSFGAHLLAVCLLSQSAQKAGHVHGAEGVEDLVAWLTKRKMPGSPNLGRSEKDPGGNNVGHKMNPELQGCG